MSRVKERLIDAGMTTVFLFFGYLMRDADPSLAGVIVAASVAFWFQKNALAPTLAEQTARDLAKATAAQLHRAQTHAEDAGPQEVEIVGQNEPIEVDDVTDPARPKKPLP